MTTHEHTWDVEAAIRNSAAAQTLTLREWHERVPLDIACGRCGEVRPWLVLIYLSERPTPGGPWTALTHTLNFDDVSL